MTVSKQVEHVAVDTKANVYFDGKVVSHTLWLADGSKKTLGLIFPGTFNFKTDAPELMEIVSGDCRVRIADEKEWRTISHGNSFEVPRQSSFDIEVVTGMTEYICSFIK